MKLVISSPEGLEISATWSNYTGYGVSCNGASDGSIDVTVTGGAGNYTYCGQMMQQQKIFGLSAGTYSVTATDENGIQFQLVSRNYRNRCNGCVRLCSQTTQVMEFHVMEQVMVLLM